MTLVGGVVVQGKNKKARAKIDITSCRVVVIPIAGYRAETD